MTDVELARKACYTGRMIEVLQTEDRGKTRLEWLDGRHSFSFGGYFNPKRMGFRALRVINEDRVAPGAGFPMHSHADMEILTWVLSGALEHRDSTGASGVVRAGELQRMTAGTGISHSEYNPSPTEPVHLFQIWIRPAEESLHPGHAHREFPEPDRRGRLRLLASRDGREGSLSMAADADAYAALLSEGDRVTHPLAIDRHAWIQLARGSALLNGVLLQEGDGAAVSGEREVVLIARRESEPLLFELP